MLVPLKGFIFLCKIGKSLAFQGCKSLPAGSGQAVVSEAVRSAGKSAFSFLREAKQSVLTGGAEHESESYLSLHRVQTA